MSKEYSLTGVVKEVSGVIEVGQNNIPKNTVVLEVTDNGYTNDVAIDFIKDNAEKSTNMQPGMEAEVFFNIRSNTNGNGRWFTNLNGWKWNVKSGQDDPSY